jgi:hypothetical protein
LYKTLDISALAGIGANREVRVSAANPPMNWASPKATRAWPRSCIAFNSVHAAVRPWERLAAPFFAVRRPALSTMKA